MNWKLIAVVFVMTAVVVSAMAQTAKAQEAPGTPLLKQFDVEFKGGTIRELVAVIEKRTATKLNIVIDNTAADISCPPMTLRSVSAYSIIRSLQGILLGSDSDYDLHSGCLTDPYDADAILFVSCTPKKERVPEGILTQVRSLEVQLGKHGLEDIIAAIRSAWDMGGVGKDAVFKFHKDTKLLMVRCDNETEVMLLNEVLRELG